MTFEKPCRRPTCTALVRKTTRSRLNDAQYCTLQCSSIHRIEIGGHPFQLRTKEDILRNAAKAGRTRGARAHKRKLLDVAAKFEKHIPEDWQIRYGAADLARIKALAVRAYLEGREDGYQAGHTAAWRGQKRQKAA